jgi:serine/threonine protein kinase
VKAERWRQIDRIFKEAVDQPPEQRSQFLDQACADDPSLREEVEALIASSDSAESFLESPPNALNSSVLFPKPGAWSGKTFGPYALKKLLGAGGMGEVYLAEDSRLGRKVAIKLLKPELLQDSRSRERVLREARSVSQLNHPHICTLHDIGEHEGIDFLVMEYLEGETLAAHLERGPMAMDQALKLAGEIADALDAAHRHGITHRDLKPGNVMLTRSGAKLVDFGLAKMTHSLQGEAGGKAASLTTQGTILGTVHYMSPEQARGETNLTPQSDQFSFGLVLYEMVTGKRAFDRPSAPEVITAIIREEAAPLPSTTPTPLRWVIERLLSKDPAGRYDSTRDLCRDLGQIRDRLSESSPGAMPGTSAPAPRAKRRQIFAAAIGVLVVGVVVTIALLPPKTTEPSSLKFTPISRIEETETFPAWSPDGKTIAFTANVHGIFQVFTKVIDSPGAGEAAQITNAPSTCGRPFWSRDGSKIYYWSDNKLWFVTASGGTPTIELADTGDVSLHPDGKTVVFSRRGKLLVDSLGRNQPREIGQPPFPNANVLWVQFSPDGSKLIVVAGIEKWVLAYPSGAALRKLIVGDTGFAGLSWLPDSRHLVAGVADHTSNYTSTIVLVDTEDGSVQRVYSSIETVFNVSLSPNGERLAYTRGLLEWNVLEIALSGSVRTVLGGNGITSWWPDWARSGTHFLVTTNRSGGPMAIEDVSSTEGFSRRLYSSEVKDYEVAYNARWSPDGSRFAFTTLMPGKNTVQLRIANSAGGGLTTLVDQNVAGPVGISWSPDGQWIAYGQLPPAVVKIHASSGAAPVVLAQVAPEDLRPVRHLVEWSPSGDWIAYVSRQGVSLVSPETHKTRLLTARKLVAFGFSRDGHFMFGIERDTTGKGAQWQLYQIDVATGIDKLLAPVDLPASVGELAGFSMHPDGTRFLTSVTKSPFDIWMMEGFNPPKTWLDRLLRR